MTWGRLDPPCGAVWPSRFTAQVFCQLFGAHGHVAVAVAVHAHVHAHVHVDVHVDVDVDVDVDVNGDGDVAVDARDSYSSASSTR